jgi:hypothetical protein
VRATAVPAIASTIETTTSTSRTGCSLEGVRHKIADVLTDIGLIAR